MVEVEYVAQPINAHQIDAERGQWKLNSHREVTTCLERSRRVYREYFIIAAATCS